MKRFIPIFALLFAVGASAYFIYLAQTNAQNYAQGQVTLGDQPLSAPSDSPASGPAVPASTAPGSVAPETKAAPATQPKPTFQGGSKAFAPSDGMIFQGGSKAAMIDTEGARQLIGGVQRTGAPVSGAPQSAAPKSAAPESDAPAQAPNAPPSFMGGSKFDPGTLPLPKRP